MHLYSRMTVRLFGLTLSVYKNECSWYSAIVDANFTYQAGKRLAWLIQSLVTLLFPMPGESPLTPNRSGHIIDHLDSAGGATTE